MTDINRPGKLDRKSSKLLFHECFEGAFPTIDDVETVLSEIAPVNVGDVESCLKRICDVSDGNEIIIDENVFSAIICTMFGTSEETSLQLGFPLECCYSTDRERGEDGRNSFQGNAKAIVEEVEKFRYICHAKTATSQNFICGQRIHNRDAKRRKVTARLHDCGGSLSFSFGRGGVTRFSVKHSSFHEVAQKRFGLAQESVGFV